MTTGMWRLYNMTDTVLSTDSLPPGLSSMIDSKEPLEYFIFQNYGHVFSVPSKPEVLQKNQFQCPTPLYHCPDHLRAS